MWEKGSFETLLSEGRAIQTPFHERRIVSNTETFSKLMFEGKVHTAVRMLGSPEPSGVSPLPKQVLDDFQTKHPEPQPENDAVMLHRIPPFVDF